MINFLNIKAFDFGHLVINCSGLHGGQRYADIHYLFKQKSQKKSLLNTNTNNLRIVGFFESYSRKKPIS